MLLPIHSVNARLRLQRGLSVFGVNKANSLPLSRGKKLRDVSRLTKCGLLASNTLTTTNERKHISQQRQRRVSKIKKFPYLFYGGRLLYPQTRTQKPLIFRHVKSLTCSLPIKACICRCFPGLSGTKSGAEGRVGQQGAPRCCCGERHGRACFSPSQTISMNKHKERRCAGRGAMLSSYRAAAVRAAQSLAK